MLESVSSYELTEWMAYEHATGPLDNEWRDSALKEIRDQLLILNNMFAVVNLEENPVEKIEPFPGPRELSDIGKDDEHGEYEHPDTTEDEED